MNWHYFIFVWIAVMAFFSSTVNVYYPTDEFGKTVYRWKFVYALVSFWPVIYLVAFTMPRYDSVLYMSIYRNLPTTVSGLSYVLSATESGKGWTVFEWIVKVVFGGSETAFRVVLVAFHSIPVLYLLRKYSDDFLISLYLFLANSCHMAWMMNGLRQYLAVSLILAGTSLILKKKYVPLIAVILLASTIHTSALIMIPIVFIAQGEAWNGKTLLFILGAIIMTYLFSRNTGLLDMMLTGTEYSGMMANSILLGDDGVNPLRVLVYCVPVVLAFIGKDILREEGDQVMNLCVNMSIITAGLYLIAMVTSGIMIGRLPIYTSIYSFILLPTMIRKIFTEQTAKLVTVAMVILFFIYYLYENGAVNI